MKITEKMRLKKGLEIIEEISSDQQSLNPKRDWKETYEGLIQIYEIVHSLRAPKCRKNHLSWVKNIDDAIRASK